MKITIDLSIRKHWSHTVVIEETLDSIINGILANGGLNNESVVVISKLRDARSVFGAVSDHLGEISNALFDDDIILTKERD